MQKNAELKVLAIVASLSKRNGAGRMSREIVSRLREHVSLTILTEIGTGTETNEFEEYATLEPRISVFGFLRNCLRARRLAHDTDIVHAFDAYPYGIYGYAAVVGTSRKLIITGVGTYSVAPFESPKTKFLITRAYRRASKILCISRYTKKKIDEKLLGLPTSVVHMGTSALPTPSEEELMRVRTLLEIPPDAYPIISTVGEIKERKGQLDTLQGLILLKEKFPRALYVMAGADTDQYAKDIQSYATEHSQDVRITSLLKSDNDLASLYALTDIFALNSNNHETHFEGFGLVILEAAQFGVPAIGSKDCGIEDAIDDGVSGILTPQMDHQRIANAIEKILAAKADFTTGAQKLYARFSWEDTIKGILQAYE